MNKITHVIFDFDGTLADSQWFWTQVYLHILRGRGLAVAEEDFERFKTTPFQFRWGYLKEKYGLSDDERPTFEEVMEYVDRFYRKDLALKPGAREYLDFLKKQGLVLSIFSATRESSVRLGLSRLGIDEYFDFVLSACDAGCGKDHPQAFAYCLDKLGVAPRQCIMVEDALYSMKTAKSVGMTVYAVADPCSAPEEEEIRALATRYAKRSLYELAE